MMFFKDRNESYWPISSIKEIERERKIDTNIGEKRVHTIVLSHDDERLEVSWNEVQRILRENATSWPAAVGTYVVYSGIDDGVAYTHKFPVIAWCNSPEEGVLPITVRGCNDDVDQMLAVLMPTGEVVAYDQQWDDLNAFITKPHKTGTTINV
jgi:hypothetical protein